MAFRKNLIDFMVGADPEFLMLNRVSKEIVYATHICQDMREHAGLHELGADGCGSTFEARPQPSENPLKVVNNLHQIFIGHCARHPQLLNLRWQAGSHQSGAPLGGHIHFGLSNRKLGGKTGTELLSNYVGALSILLEDKEEGKKRRSTGYGGAGDHRIQKYGFEYRTPSSWLTSPYVAAGFLCLAKTVIWEAVNNPQAQFGTYVVDSDFRSMNSDKMMAKLPLIWADITKMHLYQKYKIYIDVLYYLANNKLKWYAKDGSMNATWGLNDISLAVPKSFELDTIWARVKEHKTVEVQDDEKPVTV